MIVHLAKLRALAARRPSSPIRSVASAASLAAVLLLAGCDSVADQEQFADDASARSSGYTQTTRSGEVVETDPDDWRQAPFYAGQFYISDPAYPNPATFGEDVVVTVSAQVQFDGVFPGGLRASARTAPTPERPNGQLVSNLDVQPGAQRAGLYTFQLPVALLGRGLVRVLLLTGNNEIVSYGDVLIQ